MTEQDDDVVRYQEIQDSSTHPRSMTESYAYAARCIVFIVIVMFGTAQWQWHCALEEGDDLPAAAGGRAARVRAAATSLFPPFLFKRVRQIGFSREKSLVLKLRLARFSTTSVCI